ncbi:xanthine dehydrogenase accessory protein XdhC [Arsenicitalea aurantiaca]|uniref:Xanthine dehydrogenase accessory protein XdhC n=1 Tax=Arsenicitalea aurantiaca TaxID=1783274 RepID=A0A433XLH0_9HYPH|nr:xanthine dehydrogenase accessory protein XdhC [Arsenicitalea aurantiaca]RUT34929.1 xanthine dehydrogenase accessory protein XdhC [Arsenicitalea aurantiaca]
MDETPARLRTFLAAGAPVIIAELIAVRGSSPRRAGTWMLITESAVHETIGGGALEYMVIARARQALRDGLPATTLDVPLGPEIGQCCGGRVEVSLKVLSSARASALLVEAETEHANRPQVLVFGAGHVGRALAQCLALLPVAVEMVDTRPDVLQDLPAGVVARAVAMPEALVRAARPGAAHVIVTHDHALDFLIAAEALGRGDAAYVGMVGSRTKRARFASWYLSQGGSEEALSRLVLPIGAQGLGDKRPEVIAALAAAEIMVHIGQREARDERAVTTSRGRAVHES